MKVHIVTANLQADVSAEVRYNLTAAIQIASYFSNSKKTPSTAELNYFKAHSLNNNPINSNKSKTCFHCQKQGHIKSECRKFKTIIVTLVHKGYNNRNNFNN